MNVRPAPPDYQPFEVLFDLAGGLSASRVAYREAPSASIEAEYTHSKIAGPKSDFARVLIRLEPLPAGSGFVFETTIAPNSFLHEFLPGVERGIRAAMTTGPLIGSPIIDLKATWLDGVAHDVDSSVVAFDIASRVAFRKGAEGAQMKLLEPIMKVEVASPEDYAGTVIGDLNARRGKIQSQEMREKSAAIVALVPCANLLSYGSDLRRITNGRANCEGFFIGLADAPIGGGGPFAGTMAMRG